MTILIPAYKPDQRLSLMVGELQKKFLPCIVIVDDGSGPEYGALFRSLESASCTVLSYPENHGKGFALKTGFQYIATRTYEDTGVVTADADGQHLVRDIIKIAAAISNPSNKIVMGTRAFGKSTPLRSRIGNSVSGFLFRIVCGREIRDTQTGLRGFPFVLLPRLVKIEGDRFDYEANVLMEACAQGMEFRQIEIETIYGTSESHYHTVSDSARIACAFAKTLGNKIKAHFFSFWG